jgi:hypothetical protein
MAIMHALSFPGLFAPAGLLGAGPQTTAWLYMFWHSGFSLFVMAYAGYGVAVGPGRPRRRVVLIGGGMVASWPRGQAAARRRLADRNGRPRALRGQAYRTQSGDRGMPGRRARRFRAACSRDAAILGGVTAPL